MIHKPGQSATNHRTAIAVIALLAVFAVLLGGCSMFKAKEEENASADEMYAEARENMEKKNWRTAVEQLRELEAKYPYGVHAEQSQLDTIYAHYRNNDTGQAV
ncbi:MAG: tetratricopeptide repeat protein, partial [Gammaproteobacteria bacterium]|nr:tetratricopeptide repeat protein [Gammaproteobacteria bacterium]